MERVEADAIEVDDNLIYRHKSLPFTGTACEYWPDGRLRTEVSYVNGMEDGPSREWYENGNLMSEAAYQKGRAHGVIREWDEAGKLREETRCELGYRLETKKWDARGNLIDHYILDRSDPQFANLQIERQTN